MKIVKSPLKKANDSKIPTIRDFSPHAVQKAILSEAIQHPMTVYPTGIALISLLYMLLISFDPTSFLVLFLTLPISIGSFIFNFFIRGRDLEVKYIQRLRKSLEEQTERALKDLRQDLVEHGELDGAEQVDKLKLRIESLEELLKEKLNEGEITYGRYLGIAKQVYFSGIDNLQNVLNALKSIKAIIPNHVNTRLQKLKTISNPDNSVVEEITALETRKQLRENQLIKVKNLLLQNEAAITQLDKTTVAIAEMQTVKGKADVDMETAMAELAAITERARDYSL